MYPESQVRDVLSTEGEFREETLWVGIRSVSYHVRPDVMVELWSVDGRPFPLKPVIDDGGDDEVREELRNAACVLPHRRVCRPQSPTSAPIITARHHRRRTCRHRPPSKQKNKTPSTVAEWWCLLLQHWTGQHKGSPTNLSVAQCCDGRSLKSRNIVTTQLMTITPPRQKSPDRTIKPKNNNNNPRMLTERSESLKPARPTGHSWPRPGLQACCQDQAPTPRFRSRSTESLIKSIRNRHGRWVTHHNIWVMPPKRVDQVHECWLRCIADRHLLDAPSLKKGPLSDVLDGGASLKSQ